MCREFGVSSSGYYAWGKCEPSARALEDARLTARIRHYHARFRGRYGAPNIHADLREIDGFRVGQKRVARLMKAEGLQGRVGENCSQRLLRGRATRCGR
jgi:transposase InsO family protein